MKVHSTNYFNTFIETAEDCPVSSGRVPPIKGDSPSVAHLQFDLLTRYPYHYTSDDLLFEVFVRRKDLGENEREDQRRDFFSKGQPCFRASPLTKSYGWGVHCNEEGKMALYGMDTQEYQNLLVDGSVKRLKAMRSNRKQSGDS